MKKYLLFATALAALASCTSDEFVGDQQLVNEAKNQQGAIVFATTSPAVTRADLRGADAAAALNNAFVVEGTKGSTSIATNVVFDNYNVNYVENTANTTESNSSNWEYVGIDVNALASIPHDTGDKQTIKYWDYSQGQYDFIAYSLGNGGATATTITPTTATSTTDGAYTLTGTTAQLKTAHIADLVTVKSDDYGQPVQIKFRSLGAKVRMGLYETIPGYSVKDVKFYADAETGTTSSATNGILFTSSSSALPTSGTYTVYFPHVNQTSTDTYYSDNNVAHVTFVAAETDGTQTNQTFGALTSNYIVKQRYEDELTGDAAKLYLGRSSNECTFAGTTPFYQDVLPNETGAALTLKVDYTLVSIDGTKETINVTGASAVVPAIFAQWKPGYAYTYIFKISDNTNGKTNPSKDAIGLHPITFDAVVEQATDGIQETVTTVATPSITTYQHDPAINASANNEYVAGTVYAMVMNEGTLMTDLNGSTSPTKDAAKLYLLSGLDNATEADVMEALNMQAKVDGTTITGRNHLVLTEGTIDNAIADEDIPGPDGNLIEVADGEASKLTVAAGTYAYVYTVTQKSGTDVDKYEAVTPANGADLTDLGYYSRTGEEGSYTYTLVTTGTADGNTIYYDKYTVNDGVYAVKVIKVVAGS